MPCNKEISMWCEEIMGKIFFSRDGRSQFCFQTRIIRHVGFDLEFCFINDAFYQFVKMMTRIIYNKNKKGQYY